MPYKPAIVAEAVKDFLNGQTLSETFAAVHQYAPRQDFADLKDLYVAVVATNRTRSYSHEWATRSRPGKSFPVYVFVVKRLEEGTDPAMPVVTGNTEVDDLLAFCDQVSDLFTPGPFQSTGASISAEDSLMEVDGEMMMGKTFYCRITIPFIYTS